MATNSDKDRTSDPAADNRISNLNVSATTPLITPDELSKVLPMTDAASKTVIEARQSVVRILRKEDPRLLVIIGPCSIHDPVGAIEYAERLAALKREVEDQLFLVMRTYLEKPRTTTGWKGLLNDPYLDGTYDMRTGLHAARELLLKISEMGIPAGTEVLDPIVPQYLAELKTWASIGARTTESQTHRELASGLSMPVGFKNSTDGNLQVAINALLSSRQPHHFLGIDHVGRTCVIATRGNQSGHIILRGGMSHPNYDPVSITMAQEQLSAAGLAPLVMVDCSHDNSGKRPHLQAHVLKSVLQQRMDGNTGIIGVMIESYLKEGNQRLARPSDLEYGVSITDPCLSWEVTEELLRFARKELATGAYGGSLRRSF
jgi:3-deoxy-7-phosphoheptulonate synthase